jgi:hypothetical protein
MIMTVKHIENDADMHNLKVGDGLELDGETCTVVYVQPYQRWFRDFYYEGKRSTLNQYPTIVIQQDDRFGVLTAGDEIGDFWGCSPFGESIVEALANELQRTVQIHYGK